MDSLPKTSQYIKRLHHIRFDKIDVIRNPSGRYSEYDVLINLHTRENYEGYDGLAEISEGIKPRYSAGKKFSSSKNLISFTYTRNKWNFSVNPDFNWSRNEDYFSSEKHYLNNNLYENTISNKNKAPNKRSYMRGKSWDLNIDYQLNNNHSISASYYYGKEDNDIYNHSTMLTGPLDNLLHPADTITLRSVARDNGYRHTWGMFYKGRVKRWDLWIGANYSHNPWRTRDETERSSGFKIEDNQSQRLNYSWVNAEINRSFFKGLLALNVGYENTWRKYTANVINTSIQLTSSIYRRNRVYASADLNIIQGMSLNINGSMTFSNNRSASIKEIQNLYTLGARVSGNIGPKVFAAVDYTGRVINPLAQLRKDYGQFTDSLWWTGGNPRLKSAINHNLMLHMFANNLFGLSAIMTITPHKIENITEERIGLRPDGSTGPYIASQPQNTYFRYWKVSASCSRRISGVRLSISGGWSDSYSRYSGMKYHEYGPYLAFTGGYSPTKNLKINFIYDFHSNPSTSAQGYGEGYSDMLQISIVKIWLDGFLDMSIHYFVPLHFASGKNRNWHITAPYYSYSCSNPQHYMDNSFSISFSYRIMGGKSVRHYKRVIFGGN